MLGTYIPLWWNGEGDCLHFIHLACRKCLHTHTPSAPADSPESLHPHQVQHHAVGKPELRLQCSGVPLHTKEGIMYAKPLQKIAPN